MTIRTALSWMSEWRPHVLVGLVIGVSFAANVLARDSQSPAAQELAIVGARMYPSPDAAPVEDSVVVIEDGRIVRVGTRSNTPVSPGVHLIDARGAVLTAGFWNNHIHLMTPDQLDAATGKAEKLQASLEAMLTRWGFTTVFDIASSTDNALALRRRINSGEIAGPTILTVGDPFFPKDGTPIYVREFFAAHGWPSDEVATPEEAAARAAHQLDRGTDGVKLFAGAIVGGKAGVLPMRLDIAKALVAEAHRRGKPAFAHPSNLAGLNVAIESGVDVLAHTTAMDGGGVPGGWSKELISRLRKHNMALIPTMSLFEVEAHRTGESPDDLAQAIAMITTEVKNYAAAGGQILFGTDVGYTDAFDTTEEYRLMSAALDWRKILDSLTTAPAARFGFATRKGAIAKGMDADLVLLNADPAQDPTAFARVRDTIRGGRVIWGRDLN
ncbi:MAG: amidohydrolase family protein [Proteobacteria bacterium]|nr:amidohydrolase family protein [Pseudomonadota bacterium]